MAGAIGLLAITIFVLSYVLIEHERSILTDEIEKSVILQGRNIALTSAKALLRSDPEYELYPLVTRISEKNENIFSVVITDSTGLMLGGMELQNLSQQVDLNMEGYQVRPSRYLEVGERMFESDEAFMFRIPILSLDNVIGYVHMTYSKHELLTSIGRAIVMTVTCGVGAFILAIAVSLHLFRRISQPLETLVRGVNAFGLGGFDTRIRVGGSRELRELTSSINQMAKNIVEAQKQLVEKEVTDRELNIAHDIQSTLIPKTIVDLPGYEIDLYYKPARQVGGDYLDVIQIDEQKAALVVADVSGKGVPGLVVTGMLKIMVHELVQKALEPKEIVRRLNIAISKHLRKNMFVTIFLAMLDVKTGKLSYACAGHTPTLVYQRGLDSYEFKRMKVPPMGILSDEEFCPKLTEKQMTFEPGDVLLQYTDGLPESRSSNGEPFGYQRLLDLCRDNATAGPHELIDLLVRAEERLRGDTAPRDDLSLLCVRATASEPERVSANVV
ncbi:MAG: SpoIIE family protein phosphatase [Candidatus Latescibacterota bacterium]|nr:MAG: SpoIIE family protein phosphatase [Candidatus Latescibacterota bacterium]